MRTLPGLLEADLAEGVATLAACWRLTRKDGVEVFATNHDQPLVVAGHTYQPALALEAGHGEASLSPAGDTASVRGALDVAGITADDIAAGRWDGARVAMQIVDWRRPEVRVPVWTGWISRISRRGAAFELDLEGALARLDRTAPHVFARTCDAALGDARCGVDLTGPPWFAGGVAAAGGDGRRVRTTGISLDPARAAGGLLHVTAGALAGTRWPIVSASGTASVLDVTLARALPQPLTAGTALALTPGCDGRWSTCRDIYANTGRFRGCPNMPGDDAVLAGPAASGNTGGRR